MQWLKTQRKVISILGIGLTWLIYAVIGEFRRPVHFIFCAVLSVWVFLALRLLLNRLPGKEEPEPVKEEPVPPREKTETELLLEQGEKYLDELRLLDEQIPGVELSAKLKQITDLTALILDVVKKQPEKRKSIDQLMRYYLPTTIKLLKQYVTLQDQKVQGENIGDGMQKVEGMLDGVILAMQKQLDAMFQADVIDITADIRVMEKKLAAEGFADNDDFKEIL